uniref:Uncharacterized protein n=1 Tax=Eutreptiella gymnastica TaxID=73025 RepID=A0A7S1JCF7_9EUGL|mmetsp:Transcript_84600/g.148365  ORF Transcript_84600/g.148365 Transcript_84600/m.148365 type:complete len:149 (+) Transcript_84600:23-469(+)
MLDCLSERTLFQTEKEGSTSQDVCGTANVRQYTMGNQGVIDSHQCTRSYFEDLTTSSRTEEGGMSGNWVISGDNLSYLPQVQNACLLCEIHEHKSRSCPLLGAQHLKSRYTNTASGETKLAGSTLALQWIFCGRTKGLTICACLKCNI